MKNRTSRFSRRGAVVVFVAIALTLILSFAAMAVDLSFLYSVNNEMQRSADAAALAGAGSLEEGRTVAYNRAKSYANLNEVNHDGLSQSEAAVRIGNWKGLTNEFTPAMEGAVVTPNAVAVDGLRPSVPLFLGPVIGYDTQRVQKHATAVMGGGWCGGIWGLHGVHGQGDIYTDSYNSDEGSYGSGGVYPNGDICSCEHVELDGNVDIHGDVMYDDDYYVDIEGTSYDITGTVEDFACDITVPEFDMNAAANSNDNDQIGTTSGGRNPFENGEWNLRVAGTQTLTLPPGKFYFTSATIGGSGQIIVTGPTEFFISGDARFAGNGIVNATTDPGQLTIYSTGSQLELTGGNGLLGSIIAPTTNVYIAGGGDFYGTILGGFVQIDGNAFIHVDESVLLGLYGKDPTAPILVK
jgi:Flp pilus assembly protein TadG